MIQHVAIEVRSEAVEACQAFYRLLGFRETEPPEALRDRAAWLQKGETQVHLLLTEDPVVPPGGHLAVVLGDYERTLDELRAEGHEPEARTEHWGSPRAFLHDPAGHLVEVMAFPPA